MYFLSVLIMIFTARLVDKNNDVKPILAIIVTTLFIRLIEDSNNFYEMCDFLSKYYLINISVISFVILFIFIIYWYYKNKKIEIVFLCAILFIKWIPIENTITLILSFIAIIALYIKYGQIKKLPLVYVTFIVLVLHAVPENYFKPTRLPIVKIGEVTAYDILNIEDLNSVKDDSRVYIRQTSLFRANNFPLIISSLYTYSKTDYCLLKTYTNLYNCSYFNIDAKKKQRFYKNYGKLTEQDYLQLGKMLVNRHVKKDNLKTEYINNKDKLILIGMLEVYENYRYIYADCDLYSCSNKKIDGNFLDSNCFINKCNDNKFLIDMKHELLAFIEKRKIQGEILSFPIRNTEYIR